MQTEILHATAVTPKGSISDSYIRIDNGQIQMVESWAGQFSGRDSRIIDASGLVVSPGWIDIQINGSFGKDFTEDPESIWEVAAQLPRFGTTSFLPTIVSAPLDTYKRAIQVLQQGPPAGWFGSMPLGLHFEGPLLNPGKKGAHNPLHLREPGLEFISGWSRANGVLLVTLAPELPGALDLGKVLIERGIVVSAGHSLATIEQAEAAFEAGVRCGTHLYNAMPSLDHRTPGLTAALLIHDEICASLIADGIHSHPEMVRLAWKCKGKNKLILVTDAVSALGMPPGRYFLGGMITLLDNKSVRLSDGTLAGSIVTLEQELINIVTFCGVDVAEVLPALSQNPCSSSGFEYQRPS